MLTFCASMCARKRLVYVILHCVGVGKTCLVMRYLITHLSHPLSSPLIPSHPLSSPLIPSHPSDHPRMDPRRVHPVPAPSSPPRLRVASHLDHHHQRPTTMLLLALRSAPTWTLPLRVPRPRLLCLLLERALRPWRHLRPLLAPPPPFAAGRLRLRSERLVHRLRMNMNIDHLMINVDAFVVCVSV